MAENKSTIVVYADWIEKFEALSDDEAGKLIKHFFRYVNDLNPTPPDRVTELSFIDIKNSLKRDLVKWENVITKKSEGGQIGNLKRWHPDLYDRYAKKLNTLEECLKIAQSRSISESDNKQSHTDNTEKSEETRLKSDNSHKIGVRQNLSEGIAKIADSVSDNVSVIVNGSVSDTYNNMEGDNLCVGVDQEKKKLLINALVDEFGFSEMKFANHQKVIFAFVTLLFERKESEHFIEQMRDYKEYKKLSREKLHGWRALIGTQENRFEDGAWNLENWADKTLKLKNNHAAEQKGLSSSIEKFNKVPNPYDNDEQQ